MLGRPLPEHADHRLALTLKVAGADVLAGLEEHAACLVFNQCPRPVHALDRDPRPAVIGAAAMYEGEATDFLVGAGPQGLTRLIRLGFGLRVRGVGQGANLAEPRSCIRRGLDECGLGVRGLQVGLARLELRPPPRALQDRLGELVEIDILAEPAPPGLEDQHACKEAVGKHLRRERLIEDVGDRRAEEA